MNFQGIPYPLMHDEVSNNMLLTLSKLSEIHVVTGFGWDNLIGTVLGAIIGAIIPASLAFYTLWYNNKSSDKQREQQAKDFQAMQDNQMEISKRAFNAQVLSANRQKWINDLRQLIAELCSMCEKYIFLYTAFNMEVRGIPWNNGTESKASEYFESSMSARTEIHQKVFRIKLMLNNNELTSRAILQLIDLMKKCVFDRRSGSPNPNVNIVDPDLITLIDRLLKVSQRCLKNEWVRVKEGR